MNENYYALLIAILKGCTPEQAFDLYHVGYRTRVQYYKNDEIDKEIFELRNQGMTNRQVGELYGLSLDAISKRYNKYKKSLSA